MTKEEYKSKIKECDNGILQLEAMKMRARDSFLKKCANFKIGDKVVVIVDEVSHPFKKGAKLPATRKEAFIGGISDKYFSGNIDYDLKKAKKDGTISNQSAGVYAYDRIELLEPAKL